jgi:hypothetical protein
VDGSSEDTAGEPVDEAEVLASIVSLSEDPMARSRLRLAKGDVAPLTPSKWREVKRDKDRCEFVVKGAITHGGPARLLDVCIKRSCPKHFPVAKRKPSRMAPSAATTSAPSSKETWEERYRRQEAERKAKRIIWEAVRPQAVALIKAHLAKVKFGVPMLQIVIGDAAGELADLSDIKKFFGVALTTKTAPLVLALSTLRWDDGDEFISTTRWWKFDPKPVHKLIAVETQKRSPDKTTAPTKHSKARAEKKKGAAA